MIEHDPLCHCRGILGEHAGCCDCALIAKVRADERADLCAKVKVWRDEWQRYLNADPTESERGRAWSRIDTLNGVLALLDESSDAT